MMKLLVACVAFSGVVVAVESVVAKVAGSAVRGTLNAVYNNPKTAVAVGAALLAYGKGRSMYDKYEGAMRQLEPKRRRLCRIWASLAKDTADMLAGTWLGWFSRMEPTLANFAKKITGSPTCKRLLKQRG